MKKIEKKFNNKIFRINNFKSLGENILKIIKSISSYGVPSYAAETSFFMLLSFAPALLFISSILKYVSFFNREIFILIDETFPNDIAFIREIHTMAENASVVTIVVLILIFTSLYTFLPNKKVKWAKQLRGGIFCTLGWEIFSILLSIYVEKFGGFSLYGSLNTIAIVMSWLYGSIYLFFIGGIINHKKQYK